MGGGSVGLMFNKIIIHDKYENNVHMIAEKNSYLFEISELLKKQWPDNRAVNIVCHGHSVPAGYFKTPVVDTFNSYPHLLHRALKSHYPYAVINVIVTAIGGESSDKGEERFERDVLAHRPDIVTIDYALNDRNIGLEKAYSAWSLMIESALSKDIKVILLTPTGDLSSKLDVPDDQLNKHARLICILAGKYQTGLADCLSSFKQYIKSSDRLEDLMSHVNHPNSKGHELVTKEIFEWFNQ